MEDKIMKKLYKFITMLLIFNILVLLFLNSCKIDSQIILTPTSTPTTLYDGVMAEYPDWLIHWLKTPLCKPPCWEGIVPGKSTFSEALDILQHNQDVLSTSANQQRIHWYFGPKVGDGDGIASTIELYRQTSDTNKFATPDPNSIIQEISITPPLAGSLQSRDIFNIYGEPEKIIFHDWNAGIVSVDLLYSKHGMVIALTLDDQDNDPYKVKVAITPETGVWRIQFYESGLKFYLSETGIQEPITEFDWKGYGTYP